MCLIACWNLAVLSACASPDIHQLKSQFASTTIRATNPPTKAVRRSPLSSLRRRAIRLSVARGQAGNSLTSTQLATLLKLSAFRKILVCFEIHAQESDSNFPHKIFVKVSEPQRVMRHHHATTTDRKIESQGRQGFSLAEKHGAGLVFASWIKARK